MAAEGGDTKVLNMQINNKQFLSGTAESLNALNTLNAGIDKATRGPGLQNMGKSVDAVKNKFSVMQIAGVTALATIANKAVNAGLNLAKSLTIGPIMDGWREYNKLLNSTQTIAANVLVNQSKEFDNMSQSIKATTVVLDELNKYSDSTVYNFGQMADNLGKFTAAGVALKPAAAAIKGLSNMAALAGASNEQLGRAMYQMSQALAGQSIKLMDWNSLVQAGMGGKSMQNAIMETARTIEGLGATMDASIAKHGSFRDSLRDGWLSTEVFTKAMDTMGGYMASDKILAMDLKDAHKALAKEGFDAAARSQLLAGKGWSKSIPMLREMGYTADGAAERMYKLSNAAIRSAQDIKTFDQLIGVVKESVGSGFARVFRFLMGDLEESIGVWSKVGDVITTKVGTAFNGLFRILQQWRDQDGFVNLWEALGNIMQAVGNILHPFMTIWQMFFPTSKKVGSGLASVTEAFLHFSEWLEKVTSFTEKLDPILKALGGTFGVIAKEIWVWFKGLFSILFVTSPLNRAILDLVSTIAELIAKFIEWSDLDAKIVGTYEVLRSLRNKILIPILNTVGDLIQAFAMLLTGDVSGFKDKFKEAFKNLAPIGDLFQQGMDLAASMIDGIAAGFESGKIQDAVKAFVDGFVNFFKELLGIASPSKVFEGFGGDIVQGLINGISNSKIGQAIGNLFGSVFGDIGKWFADLDKYDLANVFSVIFSAVTFKLIYDFIKALNSTMTTFKGFAQDLRDATIAPLKEFTDTMEAMQKALIAKAILNIALAIGVLALSLWVLSKIPADKLKYSMGMVLLLMIEMTAMMFFLSKMGPTTKTGIASLTAMAVAMTFLATAVLILSAAVLAFGKMDPKTMKQGLIGISVALGVLTLSAILLGLAGPAMILGAAAILILSVALGVLAVTLLALLGTIMVFQKVKLETLQDGLKKIAGVLLVLGLAMIPLAAISPLVLIAAFALGVLAVSLLAILGTIMAFSQVDAGAFGKGLGLVAAAIVAIGIASLVAAPGIMLLGAGMLLLGTGLMLAGAGLALAGVGLTLIAAAGLAAFGILFTALEAFVALLPVIGIQFIAAIDVILKALAEKAPSIIDSLVIIIQELLRGIREIIPDLVETGVALLEGLLDGIVKHQESLYDFGIDLIVGFINAISKAHTRVVNAGVNLIVKLIQGIGKSASKIVTAAFETIRQFLQAMADAALYYSQEFVNLGQQIAGNIAKGILLGIVDDLHPVAAAAVKKFLGIDDNPKGSNKSGGGGGSFAKGTDYAPGGLSLVGEVGPELVSLRKGSSVITNKNLVGFMRAVANLSQAISKGAVGSQISSGGNLVLGVSADYRGDPRRDGMAFAANIAGGLITGLSAQQSGLNSSMADMGSKMSQSFADILGIKSPSTVFKEYAADVAAGFIRGLLANVASVKKAATAMGQAVIQGVAQTITDAQLKLEATRARQSAYEGLIAYLQKKADKEDDVEKKEELEKEIEALQAKADAAAKSSESLEKYVNEQNAAAERLEQFRAADTQGKADMRKEDAAMAAAKASEQREYALRLRMEANLVRQYDSKRADIMEQKAATVLKRATSYSDLANKYAKEAFEYARKVQQEIDAEMAKQLRTVSEMEVQNAQAAFDSYLRALADAEAAASEDRQPSNVTFEQTINSPEALSASEIYRNTQNLVSQAERKLVPTG